MTRPARHRTSSSVPAIRPSFHTRLPSIRRISCGAPDTVRHCTYSDSPPICAGESAATQHPTPASEPWRSTITPIKASAAPRRGTVVAYFLIDIGHGRSVSAWTGTTGQESYVRRTSWSSSPSPGLFPAGNLAAHCPASVSFLRLLIRQLAVRGKRRLAGQPPIPGRHSAVAWWPRRCRGQDGPQCCAGRTGLQAVGWLCSAAVP